MDQPTAINDVKQYHNPTLGKGLSPTQQGLPVTLTDGSQGGCEVRALKPDSRKVRSVLQEN